MSDSNVMTPPLDVDLNTVDTSRPLLSKGHYKLSIEKAEIKPTLDGKGRYIALDSKTIVPATSARGENLGPGIHVFANLMLNPVGKSTWDMVTRGPGSVGEFIQSLEMKLPDAKITNSEVWVPQLMGRTFSASIVITPAGVDKKGKAFREKNEIVMFLKA